MSKRTFSLLWAALGATVVTLSWLAVSTVMDQGIDRNRQTIVLAEPVPAPPSSDSQDQFNQHNSFDSIHVGSIPLECGAKRLTFLSQTGTDISTTVFVVVKLGDVDWHTLDCIRQRAELENVSYVFRDGDFATSSEWQGGFNLG